MTTHTPISARLKALLVLSPVIALAVTCVASQVMVVQAFRVNVLKGKGSVFLPPLAVAAKGDRIEVTGQEGRWLKVHYADLDGYVLRASLYGEPIGPVGAISEGPVGSDQFSREPSVVLGSAGIAVALNSNSGLFSSPFGRSVEIRGTAAEWAQLKGYGTDGLAALLATRQRLNNNPVQIEQFKQVGNVGLR